MRNRVPHKITGRNTPSLGRTRMRKPDSPGRAPMPAYIRSVGVPLDEADRAYIRRKLGRKLGKFVDAVERMSVRIEDVNGPRGGRDKRCRIKITLRGMASVVVEAQHATLQAAIDGALDRAGHTVTRQLQRRRVRAHGRSGGKAWRT